MIRINLLPKAPTRRISGRPLFEIGIPLVVLAIVVVWFLVLSGQVKDLKGEIQKTQGLIDELRPQVERVTQLKLQIEAAKKKEALLAGLLATQMPASSILTNLRVLIPKDVWITTLTVPNTGTFSLDGSAMSYVAVARLLENLESARLFEGLDLSVAERERVGTTDTVKYSVTGRLVRPSATPEGLR